MKGVGNPPNFQAPGGAENGNSIPHLRSPCKREMPFSKKVFPPPPAASGGGQRVWVRMWYGIPPTDRMSAISAHKTKRGWNYPAPSVRPLEISRANSYRELCGCVVVLFFPPLSRLPSIHTPHRYSSDHPPLPFAQIAPLNRNRMNRKPSAVIPPCPMPRRACIAVFRGYTANGRNTPQAVRPCYPSPPPIKRKRRGIAPPSRLAVRPCRLCTLAESDFSLAIVKLCPIPQIDGEMTKHRPKRVG